MEWSFRIKNALDNNILTVTVLLDEELNDDNVEYAYYLLKDEVVVEKIWYSGNQSQSFVLNNQGVYSVTVFCRHKEKIVSQKTDPLFYFGGEQKGGGIALSFA